MIHEGNMTGQPVYIVAEEKPYKSKAAGIIGILHIICGTIALGMGIGLIVLEIEYNGFGIFWYRNLELCVLLHLWRSQYWQ